MLALLLSMAFAARPIRVLIIDTGTDKLPSITTNTPHNQKYTYSHEHGTTIAYLVINGSGHHATKIASNVIVEMCDENYKVADNGKAYIKCLKKASLGKYDFINMSLSGSNPMPIEEKLIMMASKHSRVIVAAGNDHLDIDKTPAYPAAYKDKGYVTTVVAVDIRGRLTSYSNWGNNTVSFRGEALVQTVGGLYIVSQGTSIATALYTHSLILQLQKEREGHD